MGLRQKYLLGKHNAMLYYNLLEVRTIGEMQAESTDTYPSI
jgi:hypothetical protein